MPKLYAVVAIWDRDEAEPRFSTDPKRTVATKTKSSRARPKTDD